MGSLKWKYHQIRGNKDNPMVPFVTGKKRGKANSEGDFCIGGFVTCYMSHCYEVDAYRYSTPNSGSDSTNIIFLWAKLTEQWIFYVFLLKNNKLPQ